MNSDPTKAQTFQRCFRPRTVLKMETFKNYLSELLIRHFQQLFTKQRVSSNALKILTWVFYSRFIEPFVIQFNINVQRCQVGVRLGLSRCGLKESARAVDGERWVPLIGSVGQVLVQGLFKGHGGGSSQRVRCVGQGCRADGPRNWTRSWSRS